METKWSYPSEQDLPKNDNLELSFEDGSGAGEEELTYPKRTLAEILVQNPAFKSEKAERALRKIKETIKSAEQNLPEELKNELRHERKDDKLTQDPVHISTVLADAPSRQPGLASMIPDQSTEERPESDDELEDELGGQASIYRQAVISGFLAAAVLLLIFVLLLVF